MVDITFDIGGVLGSVTVHGTLVYGTKFNDTRYNQSSQRLATGEYRVYDTGVNVVTGEMLLKNVSYTNGEEFRAWLREKAVYQLNPFSIVLDTSCDQVDLGNGKGVDILNAQLTKKDDKDILKYVVPGLYTMKIPYTYVRS